MTREQILCNPTDGTRHRPMPTANEIREILDYNRETGLFTWKERAYARPCDNARRAGKVAGTITKKGYLSITIPQGRFLAHRLAWVVVHGEIPAGAQIDHRDLVKSNNRISNLRLASHSQNLANREAYGRFLKGTREVENGRFRAAIKQGEKFVYLGTFDTQEEAHCVYLKAAQAAYGEFAREDDRLNSCELALGIRARDWVKPAKVAR